MIDLLVVGAGPAGCVAAMGAARDGLRVLLVERAVFPRYKVCGCCLGPLTVEALASVGVDTRRHGLPLRRLTIGGWGKSVEHELTGHVAVSRERLDLALLQQAREAGAELLAPCRASIGGLVAGGRWVDLRTPEASRQVTARLVVVAGGLGAGLESADPGRPARQIGLGAARHDASVELGGGTVFMAAAAEGYVGLVGLEDGRVNVAASLKRSAVDRHGPGPAVDRVLESAGRPALRWTEGWRGTPGLRQWHRKQYAERMLALGDAAGFGEPFTGEGIGWAVTSAVRSHPVLARLVRDWSDSTARRWDRQQRAWRRRAQRGSRLVGELTKRPGLGRLVLAIASRSPRLLDRIAPRGLAVGVAERSRTT